LDDIPTEYRAMLAANYPPRRDDDIDGWFDYFQREIANYKQAIRRIIQDVKQLRDQHKSLTAANGDLRTKIENYDKKRKVLYEIFEGDKLDKAKLQDIFSKKKKLFYLIIKYRF
jgi:chromosome segregation ATPase